MEGGVAFKITAEVVNYQSSMSLSDRLLSFHEEGHSTVSKPAPPGAFNVFRLKAQDGIKEVVGDFTISQHKHLF